MFTTWCDLVAFGILWRALHEAHRCNLHCMQKSSALASISFSGQIPHGWVILPCTVPLVLWDCLANCTTWLRIKLLGKFFSPPGGISKMVLHSGQLDLGMSWVQILLGLLLLVKFLMRHLRQNVWPHGSTFESVMVSVHMGHSVMSLISFDQRLAAAAMMMRLNDTRQNPTQPTPNIAQG